MVLERHRSRASFGMIFVVRPISSVMVRCVGRTCVRYIGRRFGGYTRPTASVQWIRHIVDRVVACSCVCVRVRVYVWCARASLSLSLSLCVCVYVCVCVRERARLRVRAKI